MVVGVDAARKRSAVSSSATLAGGRWSRCGDEEERGELFSDFWLVVVGVDAARKRSALSSSATFGPWWLRTPVPQNAQEYRRKPVDLRIGNEPETLAVDEKLCAELADVEANPLGELTLPEMLERNEWSSLRSC